MRVSISIDVDTIGRDPFVRQTSETLAKGLRLSWDRSLPRLIDFLEKRKVSATFFIVAEDARRNPSWVRSLIKAGHEIASHSLTHPKQLSSLSKTEIRREIVESKKILEDVSQRPVLGFRTPGYKLSHTIFETLEEAGYVYDASLNLSIPYNTIKWLVRYLIPATKRAYIFVERPRLKRRPLAYRPSKVDYTKPALGVSEGYNVLEIPIFLLNWIHWPMASSLFQLLGPRIAGRLVKVFRGKAPFVPIELHDFEFVQRSDYLEVYGSYSRWGLLQFLGININRSGQHVIDAILSSFDNPEYVVMQEIPSLLGQLGER